MFALEAAEPPRGLVGPRTRSWANLDGRCEELHLWLFQHAAAAVSPEAARDSEVSRDVIRGNGFKYLNIFVDAV